MDLNWRGEEDEGARLYVFLVTLAPVLADTALAADVPLRTLTDVTREQVRDAVLDAVANVGPPDHPTGRGRPRAARLSVVKLKGWQQTLTHTRAHIRRRAFAPHAAQRDYAVTQQAWNAYRCLRKKRSSKQVRVRLAPSPQSQSWPPSSHVECKRSAK